MERDGERATISLAGIRLQTGTHGPDFSAARLVAHPHDIGLSRRENETSVPGTVLHAAYLYRQMQYTVGIEVGEVFVVDNAMREGFVRYDRVFVSFEESKLSLVPG